MKYSVSHEGNGRIRLHVQGELDACSVGELRPLLDQIVEESPSHVVVDLSELRLIDSSGVGAIVSLFKRTRGLCIQFEVVGVQGQPLSIFQLLRLDRVFRLRPPCVQSKQVRSTESSVEQLCEALVQAKERGRPAWWLLGAGCSVCAGIPAAQGFVDRIRTQYRARYEASVRDGETPSYADAMASLTPGERRDLVHNLTAHARPNPAHLAVASLMKHAYGARVLTTNFDNLVPRSCALYGIFPAIYDLTASIPSALCQCREPAVLYLHGQHSGLAQVHTQDETEHQSRKLEETAQAAIASQPLVVVGYSGANDALLDSLIMISEFPYGVYWVTYQGEPPAGRARILVNSSQGAFALRAADADSFFLNVLNRLGIAASSLIEEPLSALHAELRSLPMAIAVASQNEAYQAMLEAENWLRSAPARFCGAESGSDDSG